MNRSRSLAPPYLYEINLRRFLVLFTVLRQYRSACGASVKDDDNTYHLKGDVGR